jgi:hypothetical protein
MRRHTRHNFTTLYPASELRALTPSPGHLNSTSPSSRARRVCHEPIYWHTSTYISHLHSSQAPPQPPWGLCCSNASRTPGSPSPSTRDETNSCTTTTFNRAADTIPAVATPLPPPAPVAITSRSGHKRTFPCSLQQLSNHLREGGG